MTNYISTKELYTSLKTVSENVMKGDSYIVLKYSKPAFQITPLEDQRVSEKPKKYTWADLDKFIFPGKKKNKTNLAQTYKKYLYGSA